MSDLKSELRLVTTADGSKTIFNPGIGENYHSKHGALQESRHVFVRSGLEFYLQKYHPQNISVLEVGFGTGLNFLLSADYCSKENISLSYTGIEAFPLQEEMIFSTGYEQFVSHETWKSFMHSYVNTLKEPSKLSEQCTLRVSHCKLLDFNHPEQFDLVYFDAFAAVHQPEMWNDESLAHIAGFIKPGGVFVTYAITGNLKRSMKSLGFTIEKAPGAPGKREMLRAVKI